MSQTSQGFITSIKLPDDFVQGKEEYNRVGMSWLREYYPSYTKDITIAFLYRGSVADEESADAFRSLLKQKLKNIINSEQVKDASNESLNIAQSLAYCLGNVGDNQFTNSHTGLSAPGFQLKSLSTHNINGITVLKAEGIHKGASENSGTWYVGIFFDGTPSRSFCQIEELFLQAPSQELLENFRLDFKKTLSSIEWKK